MNRNYGKLNEGVIEYAPNNVRIGDTIYAAPTAEQYASCGWLPVVTDNQPTGKVGVYYTPSGWEQTATDIRRTWAEHPIVAPVKHYKVEEIIYGLITRNALQGVKQIVGDYWELLTMRDVIDADNEIFAAQYPVLKAAIAAAGVLTEEEVDAVLAEAEVL